MSSSTNPPGWIEKLEVADANVKWAWSHFAGLKDTFNEEGQHNFIIIIPPEEAQTLFDIGWNIKEKFGPEEGDPPEFHLKANISYKFDDPAIFFIKGERRRKMRAKQEDLADIRRDAVERIDVILKPSKWGDAQRGGITAYVEEMYVVIRESRFAAEYADYEEA